jgi:hypothetical protein
MASAWGGWCHLSAGDQFFDAQFNGVVEFVAIGAEELDAIVRIGIVGGGDDDARIGAQAAGYRLRPGWAEVDETFTPMARMPEESAFSA